MGVERWNRGVDVPGAMLYRLNFDDDDTDARWVRNMEDVRYELRRCYGQATVDRVILTAKLTPKTLALALLNRDPIAFSKVERVEVGP